jgi:hypothetical protein
MDIATGRHLAITTEFRPPAFALYIARSAASLINLIGERR